VATVNKAHLEFCSSPEWARLVEDELLPWVLDGRDLGDALLEVGPGPGLTTDVLRRQAARLAAAELAGSNAAVVLAGASQLPHPDKTRTQHIRFCGRWCVSGF